MSNCIVLARPASRGSLLKRGGYERRTSETVGSNFFLTDRRQAIKFKKGPFTALAKSGGLVSAGSLQPKNSDLLLTVDRARTFLINSSHFDFIPSFA
jgi:hypothetical protein